MKRPLAALLGVLGCAAEPRSLEVQLTPRAPPSADAIASTSAPRGCPPAARLTLAYLPDAGGPARLALHPRAAVSDEPVWLLADAERPLCRLAPRAVRELVGSEPWEETPLRVLELAGSCDVGGRRGRLAVQQVEEPQGCVVDMPRAIQAPLASTPGAPAEIAEAFAGRGCGVGCEARSHVVGVASGRRRLEWSVSTHVHPAPSRTECTWESVDLMSLLARDGDGPIVAVGSESEIDAPFGLDEVVLDGETIVALVDRDPRRLHVWEWPLGAAPRLATTREIRWAHDEEREHQSLTEACEP
jgi:hypothetical protein